MTEVGASIFFMSAITIQQQVEIRNPNLQLFKGMLSQLHTRNFPAIRNFIFLSFCCKTGHSAVDSQICNIAEVQKCRLKQHTPTSGE
jgi:hypothetical protein